MAITMSIVSCTWLNDSFVRFFLQTTAQIPKEVSDAEKSEKSESKTDETVRATRKTPKRSQPDAPKLSSVVELKMPENDSCLKETADVTSHRKTVGSEMSKMVRQRRSSALMRLTRTEAAVKILHHGMTGRRLVTKVDRTGKKYEHSSGSVDDRSDRKLATDRLLVAKEENSSKKKSTEGSDNSEDKKSCRVEVKRSDHGLKEKPFSYKRVSLVIDQVLLGINII